LDCRYLNLFLPYERFKYEQLSGAVDLLQPNDYFVLTDTKSGYHHIPIHKDTWAYLAIEIDGQLYAYTHMPFGLATACKIYTIVRGLQNMTYLIDDALFAYETRQQGLYRTMTLWLSVAWGFHLSWEKCELLPVPHGRFLGLEVDTVVCQLSVPPERSQRIKDSILSVQNLICSLKVAPS